MAGLFLNSKKTLYTCENTSCAGCKVSGKLVCHFNGLQLALFMLISLPLFLSAAYFVFMQNSSLFIFWGLFALTYFGLIEIRVMCSHCPHYAEPELVSLKCWANYGMLKFWKYRPGPMSIIEKVIFFTGFFLILSPPIYILLVQKLYLLLTIYIVWLIGWKLILRKFYCKKCINFACPFNAVAIDTKNMFLDKNNVVKKAWTK